MLIILEPPKLTLVYLDDSSDAVADSSMVNPKNVSKGQHEITLSHFHRNSLEDLLGASSFWQQPPKLTVVQVTVRTQCRILPRSI